MNCDGLQVNKWLAEHHTPEQSLSADFLTAPRRRRPRVDPTLLDWKKLSGDENVSVINRETGKKVSRESDVFFRVFESVWCIEKLK